MRIYKCRGMKSTQTPRFPLLMPVSNPHVISSEVEKSWRQATTRSERKQLPMPPASSTQQHLPSRVRSISRNAPLTAVREDLQANHNNSETGFYTKHEELLHQRNLKFAYRQETDPDQ